MAKSTIKVVQIRSAIGREGSQRKTLIGLGLNKLAVSANWKTHQRLEACLIK